MTDLIKRLLAIPGEDHARGCEGRNYSCNCGWNETIDRIVVEAADALAEAAEREKGLREALKPFGRVADSWDSVVAPCDDDDVWTLCNPDGDCIPYDMKVGDFRRARKALSAGEGE